MNGFRAVFALASKPGDDLLFHCLSNSTIGAVWFHGRVRDGIGWVTDAMATKLWGQRKDRVRGSVLGIGTILALASWKSMYLALSDILVTDRRSVAPGLSLMVGFIKRE